MSGLYYQADFDFQVRAPFIGKTFALSGQAAMGHFDTTVQSGDTGKVLGATPAPGNSYALNIYGAELTVSLQDPTWTLAVRGSMVIPDSGFQGTWKNSTTTTANLGTGAVTTTTTSTYAQIFSNINPIWEVTPSVSYSFNSYCKLTAEVMLMFNEPEAVDSDGNYVISEMPGLAQRMATGSYAAPNISAFFVPIARMVLQFAL